MPGIVSTATLLSESDTVLENEIQTNGDFLTVEKRDPDYK